MRDDGASLSAVCWLRVVGRERENLLGAAELVGRVLHFLEQRLGPEHLLVAAALLGLAQVMTLKDERAPVEQFNLRALHIRERHLGPEHASSLHALARL